MSREFNVLQCKLLVKNLSEQYHQKAALWEGWSLIHIIQIPIRFDSWPAPSLSSCSVTGPLPQQKVLSNISASFVFSSQSFYLLSVPVSSEGVIQLSSVLFVHRPVILSFVCSCLIKHYPTLQGPLCSEASHSICCLFLSHQKVPTNIPVSFMFTG